MPAVARRSRPVPRATVVLLVRHGLTPTTGVVLPGRAPGLHLSDDGRRQAEDLAKRLAVIERIAAVYSSPLERARETAAPIAGARRQPVRVERGLLECEFGRWTGERLDKLARTPEWTIVQRNPSGFRFPGGESFVEMQARIVSALARLVERHPGETIVAVSHADPIKAAVTHALGAPLDSFQRVMVAPASVTAVAYRPLGTTVLTVNAVDADFAALARP
jgi:probable phosphomutase (TIGR03848 family)